MKLTLILSILTISQLWATESYSQMTKLTVKLEDVKISDALKEIENQSEFFFLYSPKLIDVERKVNIDAEKESIKDILSNIFDDKVKYVVYDRQIILTPGDITSLSEAMQQLKITGTVANETGSPLVGVTVLVKGTTLGTLTDISGKYTINNAPQNATLIFSFVGMTTQEIPSEGRILLDVVLKEVAVGLDEVVVVGYGTNKKRDIIGSIATVNSDKLNVSTGNVISSIQGLSSGVQISSQGGTPGAPVTINIRGLHSINSDQAPLIIIDGMPIYSGGGLDMAQAQGAQAQSPMSMINPNDIENMQILKDAAATAIYGSRGSNGVILITTKTGKGNPGKATVSLDYSGGISGLTKTPYDIGYVNTTNWFDLVDKARSNSGLSPVQPIDVMLNPNFITPITREEALATNTDWFEKMMKTGHYHDVNVSVSKAFDKGSIFTSFNYRNDAGVLKNNNLDRFTGRINASYEVAKNLDAAIRFNLSHTTNDRLKNNRTGSFGSSGSTVGGFPTASRCALPWFPIYGPTNPSGYWNSNAGTNPVASDDPSLLTDKVKQFRAIGGVSLEYRLPWIKGLSIRGEGSIDVIQNNYTAWASQYLNDATGANTGSSAYESASTYNSFNYNIYTTYGKTFGFNSLTITAGTESQRTQTYTNNMQAIGLLGAYHQLGMVQSNRTLMQGYLSGEDYLRSYFGRADYKLLNRYIAGISIRQDGSSKFGADYRWGTFTAFSLGWIVSEENFLKGIGFINQLKLRGSMGQTGNNKIPNSLNVTTYENSFNSYAYGTLTAGTAITNIGTQNLTWETTTSYDGGIDFALFKNRLSGSIAYYYQNVDGLILAGQVAPSSGIISSTGAASIWGNVGKILNKGFEFSLTSKNIQTSSFSWSTDANITFTNNKVVALTPDLDLSGHGVIVGDLNRGAQVIYRNGYEMSTFYYPEFAGVDPEHGVDMIYELDQTKYLQTGETVGTGRLIPATVANLDHNKFILKGKTSAPKYFGGFSNTFTYKGFDLGIGFIFSGGNYVFDKDEWVSTTVGVGINVLRQDLVNNTWTSSNTNAKYPELRWEGMYNWDMDNQGNWVNTTGTDYTNDQTTHTRYLYKGDYIRLKNLELGYNLPKAVVEKLNIQGLRVYVSGSNLFTWTKYPGYDPEVALNSGGNVDNAFLPSLKTLNFGIQLKY